MNGEFREPRRGAAAGRRVGRRPRVVRTGQRTLDRFRGRPHTSAGHGGGAVGARRDAHLEGRHRRRVRDASRRRLLPAGARVDPRRDHRPLRPRRARRHGHRRRRAAATGRAAADRRRVPTSTRSPPTSRSPPTPATTPRSSARRRSCAGSSTPAPDRPDRLRRRGRGRPHRRHRAGRDLRRHRPPQGRGLRPLSDIMDGVLDEIEAIENREPASTACPRLRRPRRPDQRPPLRPDDRRRRPARDGQVDARSRLLPRGVDRTTT